MSKFLWIYILRHKFISSSFLVINQIVK